MEKNLEINKLSDIVAWADGIIRDAGYNEEKYQSDGSTAYCHVKAHELWRIRDVALKSMERQTVYTNALKNDIGSKDAKIEKLEKEIEGRKECYTALKELVDTKYISIEEHNDIVKKQEDTIEDYEDEIKNLTAEIERRKEGFDKDAEMFVKLKEEVASKDKEIERLNIYTANQKKVNHDLVTKITLLESELADCKVKIRHQRENLDGINKTLEIRTKEKESLVKVRNNLNKEIEAHESENARLSEKIMELKKERDKHMARVNDLRMELDCVKASKEKREEAVSDTVNDLKDEIYKLTIRYNKICHSIDLRVEENKKLRKELDHKNQKVKYLEKELEKTYKTKETDLKNHNRREMALVDELADKNDEIKSLKEENSYLKSELKQKQNIIKKAYERYSDEILKTRKDLMEVAYRDIEKDNGYIGFKLYVENTLIEAKGNKEEANEVITNAVKFFYREWDKEQKENEKTIEKAINDIPCGEDAIE